MKGLSTGAAQWFGEDQSRYVVAVNDRAAFLQAAAGANIPATPIGRSGGVGLTLPDGVTISIKALREAHEAFFPAWMSE